MLVYDGRIETMERNKIIKFRFMFQNQEWALALATASYTCGWIPIALIGRKTQWNATISFTQPNLMW